jgi:hypothetical protein
MLRWRLTSFGGWSKKALSDENPAVNSPQRQVLQNLRSGDWKIAKHLSVPVSDRMLETLLSHGWIERRMGTQSRLEIRITEAGSVALRAISAPAIQSWRTAAPIADPKGTDMKIGGSGEKPLTAAQREANKAFKPGVVRRRAEDQEAKSAFDQNHERLKAERLARESAEPKSK